MAYLLKIISVTYKTKMLPYIMKISERTIYLSNMVIKIIYKFMILRRSPSIVEKLIFFVY